MEIINKDKDRNAELATMAKKKAVADTLRNAAHVGTAVLLL